MAHLRKLLRQFSLFYDLGLSPAVISFVLRLHRLRRQQTRSRWVSSRQISCPRWPTDKKSVNCYKNKQLTLSFFVRFRDFRAVLDVKNRLFYRLFEAYVYRLFTAKTKCKMLTINAEIKSDGKWNLQCKVKVYP